MQGDTSWNIEVNSNTLHKIHICISHTHTYSNFSKCCRTDLLLCENGMNVTKHTVSIIQDGNRHFHKHIEAEKKINYAYKKECMKGRGEEKYSWPLNTVD